MSRFSGPHGQYALVLLRHAAGFTQCPYAVILTSPHKAPLPRRFATRIAVAVHYTKNSASLPVVVVWFIIVAL